MRRYRFASHRDEKILLDMVLVAQLCEYSKNHRIDYSKGEFHGV